MAWFRVVAAGTPRTSVAVARDSVLRRACDLAPFFRPGRDPRGAARGDGIVGQPPGGAGAPRGGQNMRAA